MRRILRAALFGCAVLGFASAFACTFSWDLPQIGGADGSTDSAADNAAKDAGASNSEASSDAASNEASNAAGCRSSKDCSIATTCVFADHLCGDGGAGTCTPLPPSCPGGSSGIEGGTSAPDAASSNNGNYCACNGALYTSSCAVLEVRSDLALSGCTTPTGDFQCGYLYCVTATQFCAIHPDDAGEKQYTCVVFSDVSSCSNALTQECPTGSCDGSSASGFTVECP